MVPSQLGIFALGVCLLGGISVMIFCGYVALTCAPPTKQQSRYSFWIYNIGWASIFTSLAVMAYVLGLLVARSV